MVLFSVAPLAGLLAASLVGQAFQGETTLARVAWLSGCWRLEVGARITEEQWMDPRGTAMLGMSRTVRGGEVVEWEFLRLHVAGDRLVYEALPSAQARAAFTSVALSDTLVAFENPTHDFPTRITYRRAGADSLVAETSGTTGGRERTIRFPFARVACP